MKSYLLVFVVLAISHMVISIPNIRCNIPCTREFRPVCAIWRRPNQWPVACTFPTECTMRSHICQTGQQWRIQDNKECIVSSRECGDLLRGRTRYGA